MPAEKDCVRRAEVTPQDSKLSFFGEVIGSTFPGFTIVMDTIPLTPKNLLAAYANGIFPMDVDGTIQWFSPDPRAIIPLDAFHLSCNLRRRYQSGRFTLRVNTAFAQVIRQCAKRDEGTWISEEIIEAYTRLHQLGWAHSVESWSQDDQLVGGLYGVAIGGAFFGESMFHGQTDASKVALVGLVERMKQRNMVLLDIQFLTPHLARFGATEIPRQDYLARLQKAMHVETHFADMK